MGVLCILLLGCLNKLLMKSVSGSSKSGDNCLSDKELDVPLPRPSRKDLKTV